MATTSLGSATTQITELSRRGLEQMEQGPSPSVRFWHTGQQWMADLAVRMAWAKAAACSSGMSSTWKARRWADLTPTPGSRANCSTRFSRAGGKYCMVLILQGN